MAVNPHREIGPIKSSPSERNSMDKAELSHLFERVFQHGGTIRSLLVALSRSPDVLIHGNDFRQTLATYDLRSLFDEAFQSPLLLESLDSVWGGIGPTSPIVEFHFSAPQVLKREIPVGNIKLHLKDTLRFSVNDAGDVRLQSGDIEARWLFMSEAVQLQFRCLDNGERAAEDVLEIAVGSLFHQQQPLEVLQLRPSMQQTTVTITETAATPIADDELTALPMDVPVADEQEFTSSMAQHAQTTDALSAHETVREPERPVPNATAPDTERIEAEIAQQPSEESSALDSEEALTAVAQMVLIVHKTPGRIRFRVTSLYRNEPERRRLEHNLLALVGIRRAVANPLTSTLLVAHDEMITVEQITESVQRILLGLDPQRGQQYDHGEPWHLLDADVIIDELTTSNTEGLAKTVVAERRREFGPNALPAPQPRSEVEMFIEQFKSLPVAMLTGSAMLSLMTGGIADALVILGVVFTNAGIGFYTERQAEKTISAITGGFQLEAIVHRDGAEELIDGEELVPGDIIQLKRGMYIPADARLLAVEELTGDESALTGESVPVQKNLIPLTAPNIPLGNRANMVYRGTVVTGGSGRAVVVHTGPYTEVGAIQRMLAETTVPDTPLQRQLDILGTQLVFGSMAVCGLVFGIGVLRGQGILPMLKSAVALAVAAVPEWLPTVATTTLALGLRRLEKQHVLVRKLSGVETLGALQIICLDKTGTITRNRMILVSVFVGMSSYDLREYRFWQEEQTVDVTVGSDLDALLRLATLCSEVEISIGEDGEDGLALHGTPTETALVEVALQAELDLLALRREFPTRRIRLRSEHRNYMDTLHTVDNDTVDNDTVDNDTVQNGTVENGHSFGGQTMAELLAIKGRPADVLTLCDRYLHVGEVRPITAADRVAITMENERMAGRALRVLGVAYLPHDGTPEEDRNLIWVGLAGIADPPRAGIPELMQRFHRAGIDTTMITGDQSATANAIAHEIGLTEDGNLEILDSNRLEESRWLNCVKISWSK